MSVARVAIDRQLAAVGRHPGGFICAEGCDDYRECCGAARKIRGSSWHWRRAAESGACIT